MLLPEFVQLLISHLFKHSTCRLLLRQVGDTFLPELIGGFAGHGLKGFQLKGAFLHEPVEFVDRARVVFVEPSESVW